MASADAACAEPPLEARQRQQRAGARLPCPGRQVVKRSTTPMQAALPGRLQHPSRPRPLSHEPRLIERRAAGSWQQLQFARPLPVEPERSPRQSRTQLCTQAACGRPSCEPRRPRLAPAGRTGTTPQRLPPRLPLLALVVGWLGQDTGIQWAADRASEAAARTRHPSRRPSCGRRVAAPTLG